MMFPTTPYNPALLALPVLSIIGGLGLTMHYYTKNRALVKQCELEFLDMHGSKRNELVKSMNLDDSDIELVSQICQRRVSSNKLAKNPPTDGNGYVRFTRVKSDPFRIEYYRCDETYAIISAKELHCFFILSKDKPLKGLKDDVYRFYEKFCYEPAKKRKPKTKEHKENGRSNESLSKNPDGSASSEEKPEDENSEIVEDKSEAERKHHAETVHEDLKIAKDESEPEHNNIMEELVEKLSSHHSNSSSSEEKDERNHKERLKNTHEIEEASE